MSCQFAGNMGWEGIFRSGGAFARSSTTMEGDDMARTGRPKAELVLSDDERLTLERLTNRRKTAQALALRARVVLACAQPGATNRGVAAQLKVSEAMVGKWRRRFVDQRLNGLF